MAPRNDSAPPPSPLSSSGRTPTAASAASKKSSRLAASRAAEVAVMRTRLDAEAVHHLAVLAQHRDRALDGRRVEPPGGVDALAQAGDAHEPLEGACAPSLAGHEQADGVGAAVDGGDHRASAPPGDSVPAVSRAWPELTRRVDVPAAGRTHAPTGSSPPASQCVVGVQALHALAGAAHATGGRGPDVAGGDGGVALGGVAGVRGQPARRGRRRPRPGGPRRRTRACRWPARRPGRTASSGWASACRRAGAARCAAPPGSPRRGPHDDLEVALGGRPSSSATRARSSAARRSPPAAQDSPQRRAPR